MSRRIFKPWVLDVKAPARRSLCSVCGGAVVGACCWKIDGYEKTTYGELSLGDSVKRLRETGPQRHRLPARVASMEHVWEDGNITDRLEVGLMIDKRLKTIWVFEQSPVRVLAAGADVCGAAVCELHAREVGDGRFHCSNHWHAWEQAA